MGTDKGNDIHIVEGKRYCVKKSREAQILKEWKCPYCGHTQLSYNEKLTSEAHFSSCKQKKKANI